MDGLRMYTCALCVFLLVGGPAGCRSHGSDEDATADTVEDGDEDMAGDLVDDTEPGDTTDDAVDASDVLDALDVPVDVPDDSESEPDNSCIVPDVPVEVPEDTWIDVPEDTAEDVVVEDVPADGPVDVVVEDVPADGPVDVVVEDVVVDGPGDVALDLVDVPDGVDALEDTADVTADSDAPADLVDADVGDEVVEFTCGDVLTDTRDGQTYTTVLIGTQCWMAQNLNLGVMVTGVTAQTDNSVVEKHCYADDPASCDVYGGLYQWDELMDYQPSDAGNPSTTQGICPDGWHVPSDEEFKVQEIALGMTVEEADMVNTWRGAGVGTAIVTGGSSGYEALLSGRNATGTFWLLGEYEYSYTSTAYGATYAWRRCYSGTADTVGRWNTFPKTWSLSLRCVLD